LRENEEKLRILFDSTHDLITLTDINAKTLWANPAWVEAFGDYSADREDPFDLIHPDDVENTAAAWKAFLEDRGEIANLEYRFKNTSGKYMSFESSAYKVRTGEETLIYVVAHDITVRRQLEEQLRQSQKMEAVGQLTAGIAHNFNNKLMVILNGIEMAMFREVGDSATLQTAKRSTLQAAELVEQLMVFSRSGGAIESTPVQVQKVLFDAMEMGRKIFDRRISLVYETPGHLPFVSGNVTQLEQIFLNLLLNARDAVEASNAPSPSIQLEANVISCEDEDLPPDLVSRQGNYICVNIIDNGIGMNPEVQQRMFEPFFTTKDLGDGTGLGLATAYAIVKDHQGWIACESQVGVGTTFSVYLPAVEQEIVPSDVELTETVPRGAETVLLVEDEDDLRDQLVSVFGQTGYLLYATWHYM
jgi:PAS domain S-box-containing protein